jgi:signal transduction histidine kinase
LTEEIRNKDLFLAFLGHELRGPVSAMVNATYLLRIAGTDDQAVVRSCDVLDRQLGQILSLVDDIQDVTRVQQGKIRLEIERTNVMSALDQGIEAARSLIDGRNHHLSVDAPSEPIYVNADASRLAQVFSNLLTNAARYTPPGGRITTGVERQDGMAAVAVRDTGFGIPAEMHERVFELFFRLDHETSQGEAGMGIGLSLVKGLVEMQGGQIELSSDGPGLGSEFVVRLPLADV